MRVEFGDQIERLVVGHALDADALAGRDVKRLAPGIGMGAHDRMGDVRRLGQLGGGQFRVAGCSRPAAASE